MAPKPPIVADTWLAEYEGNPIPIANLQKLRKDDLLALSDHFELECRRKESKLSILTAVCAHLRDNDELEGEMVSQGPLQEQVQPDIKGETLKLQIAMDAQRVSELETLQLKHELALAKADKERLLLQGELQRAKDAEKVRLEREAKPTFVPSHALRLVPHFDDTDLEGFFLNFERQAGHLEWPKDQWTVLLSSVLKGKAATAFAAVPTAHYSDYDFVKNAILQSYELVPEAYRLKFRTSRRAEKQTYVEWGRDLSILLQRWTSSCKVKEVADWEQLVLMEAIREAVPKEVRTHLIEHDLTSVEAACASADNFSLTHTVSNERPVRDDQRAKMPGVQSSGSHSKRAHGNSKGRPGRQFDRSPVGSGSGQRDPSQTKKCQHCQKPGHVISECWALHPEKRPQKKVTLLTQSQY
jgi:hypothetical protein